MTATDELRAMLNERGVEWRKPSPEYWVLLGMPEGDSSTIVGELSIEEATDGTLVIRNATPEQAIAATLGMGVNCSKAEHDAGGCLGFQSGDDDEPVDQCKACHKYTSYEVEL